MSNQLSIDLEVLSPKKTVVKTKVSEVVVPAFSGYRDILPGHAPLICELGVGFLKFVSATGAKEPSEFFVSGGFLQVEQGYVKLLADVIEKPDDIDRERAVKARARALGRLTLKSKDELLDIDRALMALRRADARLSFLEDVFGKK